MSKVKKTLTLILTFAIIMSAVVITSVITASAATYIPNINANYVTEWPTVTQNGDIYVGQSINDKLSISGGKVVYAGQTVSGTWSITNLGTASQGGEFAITRLSFYYNNGSYNVTTILTVPSTAYSHYTVKKTTLEIEEAPTASSLRPGDTLSESIISGGQVKNPYCTWSYDSYKWVWSDGNKQVTESGYYEAYFNVSNNDYEPLTAQIYVTVNESVRESKVEIEPSIPDFEYNPEYSTFADVPINGGKVVDAATGEEIKGKYVVDYPSNTTVPNVGSYSNIKVRFVPDDPKTATSFSRTLSTTITKAVCRFVDDQGNEIIPEITLPTMVVNSNDSIRNSVISGQLKTYPENATISFNGYTAGTRPFSNRTGTFDVKFSVYYGRGTTANCEGRIITLKVTIVPTEYTGKLFATNYAGNGAISLQVGEGNYSSNSFQNLDGYYYIYVNGEHVVTTNAMPYTYYATSSGTYNFKVIYEPKDENYLSIITNEMTASATVSINRLFTATGVVTDGGGSVYSTYAKQGTAITVTAAPHEKASYKFAGWKVVEGEVPEGTDLSQETLNVVMPDGNLKVESTYRFSFWLFIKNIFTTIFGFFGGGSK